MEGVLHAPTAQGPWCALSFSTACKMCCPRDFAPAQPLKKNTQPKKRKPKQCDAKTSLTDPFTGFSGVSSGPFCLVPCASRQAGAHAAPQCNRLQEVEGAHPLEGLQQLLIRVREVLTAFCRVSLHPKVCRQGGLRQASFFGREHNPFSGRCSKPVSLAAAWW